MEVDQGLSCNQEFANTALDKVETCVLRERLPANVIGDAHYRDFLVFLVILSLCEPTIWCENSSIWRTKVYRLVSILPAAKTQQF